MQELLAMEAIQDQSIDFQRAVIRETENYATPLCGSPGGSEESRSLTPFRIFWHSIFTNVNSFALSFSRSLQRPRSWQARHQGKRDFYRENLMLVEAETNSGKRLKKIRPRTVDLMQAETFTLTDESLNAVFGISYNTWRKIIRGEAIRSSLADRIERRMTAKSRLSM